MLDNSTNLKGCPHTCSVYVIIMLSTLNEQLVVVIAAISSTVVVCGARVIYDLLCVCRPLPEEEEEDIQLGEDLFTGPSGEGQSGKKAIQYLCSSVSAKPQMLHVVHVIIWLCCHITRLCAASSLGYVPPHL